MYGSVYVLCIVAYLQWHTGILVHGAGVPNQAATSKWLDKEFRQYGSPSFLLLARGIAVMEYLAKGGIESMVNLTGPQLERAFHQVDTRVMHIAHEERVRRSTTYQPYTDNPYDLGPLNQCSTPSIPRCSFSSDVTIPEYEARRIRYIFDFLDPLFDQIEEIPNFDSGCLNGLLNGVICAIAATPRCIGNDMVNYEALSATVRLDVIITLK